MVWQCNPVDSPPAAGVEMSSCSWDTDWLKAIFAGAECKDYVDGAQQLVPASSGRHTAVVVMNHLRLAASSYIRRLHEKGLRVVSGLLAALILAER